MGLFEHWPYTNFHELNLNWIIEMVKHIEDNDEKQNEAIEKLVAFFDSDEWNDAVRTALNEAIESGKFDSLFDALTGYVSPEMFGAKGDDETDDTDAFVQCFEYANEHSKAVFMPGRYQIDAGNIKITKPLHIYGTVNTKITNNFHRYPYLYTFNVQSERVVFENFALVAEYGFKIGSYEYDPESETNPPRPEGVILKNVYIYNCYVGYYHLTPGGYNKLIDCGIHTVDGGVGVILGPEPSDRSSKRRLVNTNYVYLLNTHINNSVNWSHRTDGAGIIINECQYLWLDHCDIVGHYVGMKNTLYDDKTLNEITVRDTTFFKTSSALDIRASAQKVLRDFKFLNCVFGFNVGYIGSGETTTVHVLNTVFDNCNVVNDGSLDAGSGSTYQSPHITMKAVEFERFDITGRYCTNWGDASQIENTYNLSVFKKRTPLYIPVNNPTNTALTVNVKRGNSWEPLGRPFYIGNTTSQEINYTREAVTDGGEYNIVFAEVNPATYGAIFTC